MSETPEEVKDRLEEIEANYWPEDGVQESFEPIMARTNIEIAYQLCRIADALEKIVDEGIYTLRVTQSEMDKKLKKERP